MDMMEVAVALISITSRSDGGSIIKWFKLSLNRSISVIIIKSPSMIGISAVLMAFYLNILRVLSQTEDSFMVNHRRRFFDSFTIYFVRHCYRPAGDIDFIKPIAFHSFTNLLFKSSIHPPTWIFIQAMTINLRRNFMISSSYEARNRSALQTPPFPPIHRVIICSN